MEYIIALFVPIAICVVLPIAIVYIIFRSQTNATNRKAEILIKAIETNNGIDADKLAASLQKTRKSRLEILNHRLLVGCVSTFLGIASACYALYADFSSQPDPQVAHIAYLCCAAFLAVGIGYLVVYFVTRGQINDNQD